MLHGESTGMFTRNEIQPNVPTDNFGLLIALADPGDARDAPPGGPNPFIFMQFLAKF